MAVLEKYKVLTATFLLLVTVFLLFPPFEWGNEKLRTQSERQYSRRVYDDKLPIKSYDFIFNDSKDEFLVNGKSITLHRQIIIPELIIQLIIALIISIFLQLYYRKALVFIRESILPIIINRTTVLILLVVVIFFGGAFGIKYFTPQIAENYEPNDESLKDLERKIQLNYDKYISSNTSIYDFAKYIQYFNKGYYQNEWSMEAVSYWDKIKGTIKLPENKKQLLNNYKKKLEDKYTKSNKNIKSRFDKFIMEGAYEKEVKEPYKEKLNYYKFQRFEKQISDFPKNYYSTKVNHRNEYKKYWNDTVPLVEKIAILLFLISVVLISIVSFKKFSLDKK